MSHIRLHLWFEKGYWHCGLARGTGITWYGKTPTEALRNRWSWLHMQQ